MDNSYRLLDLPVYGRQEKWEDSRPGWLQQGKRNFRVSSLIRADATAVIHAVAEWHFTTNDARIKLKSLYPLLWSNRAR